MSDGVAINDREVAGLASLVEAWWDKTGRHLVNKKKNQEVGPAHVVVGGLGPGLLLRKEPEWVLASNILMGREWVYLTEEERRRVIHTYHFYHRDKAPDTDATKRLSLN